MFYYLIFFLNFLFLFSNSSSSTYNMHFNVSGNAPNHSLNRGDLNMDYSFFLKPFFEQIKKNFSKHSFLIKYIAYSIVSIYISQKIYSYLCSLYEKKIRNHESILVHSKSFSLFYVLLPEYLEKCLENDQLLIRTINSLFVRKDISILKEGLFLLETDKRDIGILKESLFLLEKELNSLKSLSKDFFISNLLYINSSFFLGTISNSKESIDPILRKLKEKIAYILKSDYYNSQC